MNPNFDVYMLGKVLWCMVAGWPVLKREYFDRPNNDVTKLLPSDRHAYMISVILEHSVVEEQEDCCSSADDLLLVVNTNLESIKQGVSYYMMEFREFVMGAELVAMRDKTLPRIFPLTI